MKTITIHIEEELFVAVEAVELLVKNERDRLQPIHSSKGIPR